MRFPKLSKERRNVVLTLIEKNGYIDQKALDTLSKKEIDMSNFLRAQQSDGPAPYFRAELTKFVKKLLKDQQIKKSDGSPYNIYTDGLAINTTIDLDYQKYAEESVLEHMAWLQERFDKAWKGMNPWTYDADRAQREIRSKVFLMRMKSSERYSALRNRNLSESISSIHKSFPELPTSDNVFKALIKISDGKSSFRKEIKEKNIKNDLKSTYQKLISENKWELYKKIYLEHEKQFEDEFNTPVKMMVFDYEKGEKEVEMTPKDSVRLHNMFLQNATVAVDPKSGHIKAWVGGVNHKYFKYDHATTRRSVGSTLKPFVYTAAMSFGGISPCQTFDDIQYTIAPGDANFHVAKEWSPANADGKFTGNKYNLYHGLLYSKNSITVRLIKELGNVRVIRDLLDNAGISKTEELSNGRLAVPDVPSICLGAVDIKLLDMVGAYTTFANQGVYTQPIFIKNIKDKNGRVLYTAVPKRKAAINPLYNSVMVDMLRNNTGGSYGMGLKSQYGGKTGTTNDYSDGWFMGVTPELIIGVWTGGDDKWIRFRDLANGQGYVMARPVVQKFLKKLESDSTNIYNYNAKFSSPPEGFRELIDCSKFKDLSVEEEQESILNTKEKDDQFDEEFDEEF
jgi:penicillin-binding protein 1A